MRAYRLPSLWLGTAPVAGCMRRWRSRRSRQRLAFGRTDDQGQLHRRRLVRRQPERRRQLHAGRPRSRRTANRPSSAASSRPTRRRQRACPTPTRSARSGSRTSLPRSASSVTPAEVGFNGQSVKCPAAAVPALATTCTAYGQGGSRVTDPMGIGHNADGSGALTVPVVTQIANHLARFAQLQVAATSSSSTPAATTSSRSSAPSAPPRRRSRPTPQPARSRADQANLQLFAAQTAAMAGA